MSELWYTPASILETAWYWRVGGESREVGGVPEAGVGRKLWGWEGKDMAQLVGGILLAVSGALCSLFCGKFPWISGA